MVNAVRPARSNTRLACCILAAAGSAYRGLPDKAHLVLGGGVVEQACLQAPHLRRQRAIHHARLVPRRRLDQLRTCSRTSAPQCIWEGTLDTPPTLTHGMLAGAPTAQHLQAHAPSTLELPTTGASRRSRQSASGQLTTAQRCRRQHPNLFNGEDGGTGEGDDGVARLHFSVTTPQAGGLHLQGRKALVVPHLQPLPHVRAQLPHLRALPLHRCALQDETGDVPECA